MSSKEGEEEEVMKDLPFLWRDISIHIQGVDGEEDVVEVKRQSVYPCTLNSTTQREKSKSVDEIQAKGRE